MCVCGISKPNQTKLNQTNQTKLNQTKLNQRKPKTISFVWLFKPAIQTKPNQTFSTINSKLTAWNRINQKYMKREQKIKRILSTVALIALISSAAMKFVVNCFCSVLLLCGGGEGSRGNTGGTWPPYPGRSYPLHV